MSVSDATPNPDEGRRDRLACAAVLAIVGLIVGPLLAGYQPVGGDPDRVHRPVKTELARALHAGTLPLWSERFGLGMPLHAESEAAALYPPNHVLYRAFDVATAYRLSMWAHYVALALAAYAYARRLGITPWGAAIAALSFTFCGFQAIHSSHEWAYHVLPYLPLALLLADLYAATGRLGWLGLLALVLGVQWTLGHYQVQSWTGVLVVVTGLWRTVADRRPWARGAGLIAAVVWGAAIASAQLGPSWELAKFVKHTQRGAASLSFYIFPPAHLAEPAIPRLFRGLSGAHEDPYWYARQTTGTEACFYIGTIPFILAGIGLLGDGRNRRLAPWRALAFASLALATMPAWAPGLFALLVRLPVIGQFRCPARYTLITSFGLSLLAGLGFDRSIAPRRFRSGLALALILGAASFAWAAWWTTAPASGGRFASEPLVERLGPAGLVWGVSVLALLAWRRGRLGPIGPLAIVGVELAVLYYSMTTQWGWPLRLPEDSPILTRLAREPGVRRVGGGLDNLPVMAGLTTATPYFGLTLPPPNSLLAIANRRNHPPDPAPSRWLRRMGVTHTVWDGPDEAHGGRLLHTGHDPALDRLAYRETPGNTQRAWSIRRLPDPFPPAHVAGRSAVAPDKGTLLDILSAADSLDTAWYLEGDAPPKTDGMSSAKLLSWDGRAGVIECHGACDLVMARTYYPGWTYRVDDGPARPVRYVDYGLQGARIDGRGVSRVSVRYEPTRFRELAAISVVGSLLALAVATLGGLRRRWGPASA